MAGKAGARSGKKVTAEPKKKSHNATPRHATPRPPAANAATAASEARIPTREEALAWIEQDEEPEGIYEPSKEEIVDMIQEGMRQSLQGEGLRPVDELLAELRALTATDADEG